MVVRDTIHEVVDLVVKFNDNFPYGLKRDHKFGFSSNSVLVCLLTPDLVPLVEVINFVIEVTVRNVLILLVRLWIVILRVIWLIDWSRDVVLLVLVAVCGHEVFIITTVVITAVVTGVVVVSMVIAVMVPMIRLNVRVLVFIVDFT